MRATRHGFAKRLLGRFFWDLKLLQKVFEDCFFQVHIYIYIYIYVSGYDSYKIKAKGNGFRGCLENKPQRMYVLIGYFQKTE